jgi:uncharacterized protein
MISPAHPPQAAGVGGLRSQPADGSTPWWRVPMVWVVLSGPLSVVLASLATAVVAWKHIDPVVTGARPAHAQAADEVEVVSNPKDSLAPAMKARNHAATPQR